MNRPLVAQAEELDAEAAAWLAERCELVHASADDPSFPDLLAQAHGLIVRTYTHVHQPLLDRAPHLRVVGRAGVGLDRIDVAACRARNVEVVHTPDANSSAVAEFVFALLFDCTRPRLFLDRAIPDAEWHETRAQLEAPNQVCQLRLGVLGLGRIGSRVAHIARAFGMEVLAHDLRSIPEAQLAGATMVPLGTLLARADVLTIHIDPRPDNHRFVSHDFLRQLKPHVLIINTSRGIIIDHSALADFLARNPRSQAALDVHDPEPFPSSHPLLKLPNAHLSPHIAAATALAHSNMSWVVRDVWRILNGETPEFAAP